MKLYQEEGAFNIMLTYDKDEAQFGTKKPFKAFQLGADTMQLL